MVDEASRAAMKLLLRKRGNVKHKLTSFFKYLNPIGEAFEGGLTISAKVQSELTIKVKLLEVNFNEFMELQSEIEVMCDEEDLERYYQEREDITSNYTEGLALAQLILQKFSVSSSSASEGEISRQSVQGDGAVQGNIVGSSSLNVINMNLPPIKLPVFNGDYGKWLEYRETFESLIHKNESLNDIQKFHYLRASLSEGALNVIQSLEFSSRNYNEAWKLLGERFDNSRLLVNNHLKAIFNLDTLVKESVVGLRNLIDSVNKHLRSLKGLGLEVDHWDALLVYLVSTKLDKSTGRAWEQHHSDKELPTFKKLLDFLKNRADLLDTLEGKQQQSKGEKRGSAFGNRGNNGAEFSFLSGSQGIPSCVLCKENHFAFQCKGFLSLSVPERWEKVKQYKLCSNCLRKGHFSRQCRGYPCKICKLRHNNLLHVSSRDKETLVKADNFEGSSEQGNNIEQGVQKSQIGLHSDASVSFSSRLEKGYVLLSTAEVLIKDKDNNWKRARLVLDSGSQVSFVSDRFAKELKLNVTEIDTSIVGINSGISQIKSKCEVVVKSRVSPSFTLNVSCLILPKIADNLPVFNIDIRKWNIPSGIELADPNFCTPDKIDILIGAEHFWSLIRSGSISLGKCMPVLQNTIFGYIVSGSVSQSSGPQTHLSYFVHDNNGIQQDLQRFWEIEELPGESKVNEEEWCEAQFVNTHWRDAEGRFVVRIPLKESIDQIGNTKPLAVNRLLSLEKRFRQSPQFYEQYKKFINEYKELGHMALIKEDEASELYFLPHHGVVKEESLSTKLRVVFDGSISPQSGASINQIQFKGSAIQGDIFSILLRFREHPIVVTADISKMYRQIWVDPQDRILQNILWRDHPDEPMSIYSLKTVTYGMVSSPFLACRCIKQLAQESSESYPAASKRIETDFYVDDLITGFQTVVQAGSICAEITKILQSGGFKLRKWSSNSGDVLDQYEDKSDPLSVLNFNQGQSVKTLGIQWSSTFDQLSYKIEIDCGSELLTKRSLLSNIARIFDPLGLVSPCVILLKILLQEVWSTGGDWDSELQGEIQKTWCRFAERVAAFNDLTVPRHVLLVNSELVELHGYCDASERAYAAAIYLRSFVNDQVQVRLLCAKTKVAPSKRLTIPRLELCGALLLARLSKTVVESLTVKVQCHFWCDSQIVLHWLHTPLHQLEVFVRNRISVIQNLTVVSQWQYVPTRDNPADVATRGVFPDELKGLEIWWNGPLYLSGKGEWPPKMTFKNKIPQSCEPVASFSVSTDDAFDVFKKYSVLTKLVKVIAHCLRFVNNCKLKTKEFRKGGSLTPKELEQSMNTLIILAQRESFGYEVSLLTKQKYLKPKHRLLALSPFIDECGIMRVGGRLKNANVPYDQKHQILLEGKHKLSILIFKNEHIRLQHAGPLLLLNAVRDRYWPTNGMNIAKSVVQKCVTCFKAKPQPATAIMSNLPKSRVTVSYPFSTVGVDYAGPFLVKDRKGRGCKTFKSYICLFICFSTKALHLELVTNLSTDNFIAAFRRFVARRGKPTHVYSDNGTNFVGARRELSELYRFLVDSNAEIADKLTMFHTEWHFIPPYSPTFGGLWESNVKSVKYHLARVIGNVSLTYEEFNTLLVQVEGTLNSRPLTQLSSDPTDLQCLTPSHFLIGRSLISTPDPSLDDVKISSLSRFQLLQKIHQDFWKRWSKDYLNCLQPRKKWKQTTENLSVGAMVLVKDFRLPAGLWLLGRVKEIYPGDDGVVRVVAVQTIRGLLKRAITRVCPLPVEE